MLKARGACLLGPLALILCTWLASASPFDAEALVQMELRLGTAPKTKLSGRVIARDLVLRVSRQLDEFIEEHEADINKTRRMREFTEQYTNRTSDRPRIMADLTNQADADLVMMVLGFLRDPKFLKAAREGVKNMSRTLQSFSLRTEKRVTELILASEAKPKEELPRVINDFFVKEMHIAESVAHSALDIIVNLVNAAPGYEAVLGSIVSPLVARAKTGASVRLNSMLHSYLDTRGTSFCNNPLFEFTKEYIPTIEEVPQKVPLIEGFIQVKMPDVAQPANDLLSKFAKMSAELAKRLRTDIRLTAQKVCGLLGMEVATTPVPAVLVATTPAPAVLVATTPAPAAEVATTPAPAAEAATMPAPAAEVAMTPAPAAEVATTPAPAAEVAALGLAPATEAAAATPQAEEEALS